MLNSHVRQAKPKDKEVGKAERTKHAQNKKWLEKKSIPVFTLETAKQLINGHFHEAEEVAKQQHFMQESEAAGTAALGHGEAHASEAHEHRVKEFEMALKRIVDEDEKEKAAVLDEVPVSLREELRLPEKMSIFGVNFNEVRKMDVSRKKWRPIWSGQDVIPDKLDFQKSTRVLDSLNSIRVWPTGASSLFKRARFVLRVLVKSQFFENSMTLFVLLNTVTLSLDKYNQKKETQHILDALDEVFTDIFIAEMACKLLAIGVKKYVADQMNWLDGSVVLLSIYERVYTRINDDKQVGLAAFKTMRMFRTVRVFRMIRLLRALQSMQMILRVMVNSYMQFVYITMLMFLFIFIVSLLGMSLFGGGMKHDPEGAPRGLNFDSITSSFITVFQILTMENWQIILFNMMRGNLLRKVLVAIYLIAWIFLGNFILLNLFLAILLDAFLEHEEPQEEGTQL